MITLMYFSSKTSTVAHIICIIIHKNTFCERKLNKIKMYTVFVQHVKNIDTNE